MTSYTFDQLLDFARTTSGTFVGSNGLIQTTPASANLFLQTQQFDNAAWTKNNTTVAANSTVAPDGTSTADTLSDGTATDIHGVRPTSLTLTNSTTYTMSVYAKFSSLRYIILNLVATSSSNTYSAVSFDLQTGAVANSAASGTGYAVVSSSIQAVGNGWYRCAATLTIGSTGSALQAYIGTSSTGVIGNFGLENYTGTNQSSFLWGAQLELGSTATTYTRNNGGFYPPRFDYDPVTLAPKGILIEEQRVNLLLNSVFGGAVSGTPGTGPTSWTYTSTGGALTVASLGRNFACNSLRFEAASDRNWMSQTVTVAATGTYVLSANINVFTTVQLIQLFQFNPLPAGATTQYVYNGVNQASSFTPPLGAGLLQVIITTTGTGGALGIRVGVGVSSAVTGDVSFQDIQIELGAFATSYIPTGASTVTRARDQCSIVAPNFAPWFNPSEGTLSIEASVSPNVDSSSGNYYAAISDGTSANQITLSEVNGTTGQIQTSTVLEFNSKVGTEPTGVVKAALAYKTNDVILCVGGTLGTLDSSVALPTVTSLLIGIRGDASGATSLNGHMRSIRYYPVRLSDTQLQALTA